MTQSYLRAVPLGGLDEIGLNMMVYETENDMIIVDCGLDFPDEFAPGTDIVLPDIDYVLKNIDKLRAIFITHAHEDHIGALPYLWEDLNKVPVYATAFTAQVIGGKMAQFSLKPEQYQLIPTVQGEKYTAGDFSVEFVTITHSVPGSAVLYITTPQGSILATGDYKLDAQPVLDEPTNINRLKEIGNEGVDFMFGDSTDVVTDGRKPSETELADNLNRLIAAQENAIFFSTFSSNFQRMLSVTEIAVRHGRKVCFFGRSIQNMVKYARNLGMLPDHLYQNIIESDAIGNVPRSELMVIATGAIGQPNAMMARLADGEPFRGVQVKGGDTVIFSSRAIPGAELNIERLKNKFAKIGAHVLSNENAFVHVGGHGQKEEILEMYRYLKPKYAIPSYGSFYHIKEHMKLLKDHNVPTEVLVATNGNLIELNRDSGPTVTGETQTGRHYVDGYNILDSDKFILKERRQLSFAGVVNVAVPLFMDNRSLAGTPQVTTMGIIDENLQSDVLEKTVAAVRKAVSNEDKMQDAIQAKMEVSRAVKRVFQNERGRKPVVLTQIVEV